MKEGVVKCIQASECSSMVDLATWRALVSMTRTVSVSGGNTS